MRFLANQRDSFVACSGKFVTVHASTLSVEVSEIEVETPVITCSNGTPTGKVLSGGEQDARPEPSVLIDLTNSEDHEMQAQRNKLTVHYLKTRHL